MSVHSIHPVLALPGVVDRHVYVVQLIEIEDSNFQGNPDEGNAPRRDHMGRAHMTPMGYKRKIRNIVLERALSGEIDANKYDIFVKGGAKYNTLIEAVHDTLSGSVPADTGEPDVKGKKLKKRIGNVSSRRSVASVLAARYFDVRAFGQVTSTGDQLCDYVCGPVVVPDILTVDPVRFDPNTITCCATANESQADRNMGSRDRVVYGVAKPFLAINPFHAKQTGFTWTDLDVLLDAICNMWDHSQSAGRPIITHLETHVFLHCNNPGTMMARTRVSSRVVRDSIRVISKVPGIPMSRQDYNISYDYDQFVRPGVVEHFIYKTDAVYSAAAE
jgi:CRISPR-associated protein Csd2